MSRNMSRIPSPPDLSASSALVGATCLVAVSDDPDAIQRRAIIRGRYKSGRVLVFFPMSGETFGVAAHRVTVTELPPIVH